MKKLALLVFGTASLAACASGPAPMAETGYPTGSLGLAAIERGDWATAERLLTDNSYAARNDPARLVNLGRVYMATGRTAEALAIWRQAAADPAPAEVVTLGGRTARTDQLAREALAYYEVRTAAR